MEKVLRVGVLGMGNMGKAHARSMMRMENVEIAGLCSSPADDAEAFARENHLDCGIYDDGFRMIEEADLDALYICLPPLPTADSLKRQQTGESMYLLKSPLPWMWREENPCRMQWSVIVLFPR